MSQPVVKSSRARPSPPLVKRKNGQGHNSLYHQDFYAWTQQQAALLAAHSFAGLDVEHLIEEVESMGRSERRELENRVEELLLHLLKWQFQPGRRTNSWRASIRYQRIGVAKVLRQNPSLRPLLIEIVGDAYEAAVVRAESETGLPEATFPNQCPFSIQAMQDPQWLPE